MAAYYNELDPYAAQWLRNLIRAGLIAPGDVDERSIADVRATDLSGYNQCHFFAGIGIWSWALRRAGWPDDRPVWTGSCPCQPFSAAGKRGGFDDARHLWPTWFELIRECQPVAVFGEQVASKDGLAWLDSVHADLEGTGYAVGSVDTCAAGVGAPHIRQRLYWVADASGSRSLPGAQRRLRGGEDGARSWDGESERPRTIGRVAHNIVQQRQGGQSEVGAVHDAAGRNEGSAATAGLCGDMRPGPTNGFWSSADWLGCRDGKWRPVEPGTFPLVTGAAGRVGRLRAYGNGLCAETAIEFIAAARYAIEE